MIVNGEPVLTPKYKLRASDCVEISIPPPLPSHLAPEDVPFEILYQDSDLAVINKPPGIVVHPAPGNTQGTLVHGLLKKIRDLSGIGGTVRPGIVHRLDKGTSGVMLVAKNDHSHMFLAEALKKGQIQKEYLCVAHSKEAIDSGVIDAPIARDDINRKRMKVDFQKGRSAYTTFQVVAKKGNLHLLRVWIHTGRTHQIRVHLSHKGIRVIGDRTYGISSMQSMNLKELKNLHLTIERPFLHAFKIGFFHPQTKEWMTFTAPLPEDMLALVNAVFPHALDVIKNK